MFGRSSIITGPAEDQPCIQQLLHPPPRSSSAAQSVPSTVPFLGTSVCQEKGLDHDSVANHSFRDVGGASDGRVRIERIGTDTSPSTAQS